MFIDEAIKKIKDKKDLFLEEMENVVSEMISGSLETEKIATFLDLLSNKGESPDELFATCKVLKESAETIDLPADMIVCDNCGTGGDAKGTFNVSTVSSFVCAGAGLRIAKHGNRAASSKCGSADLLEAFGVNIECEKEVTKRCIEDISIGFIYAPIYHKALRNVHKARKMVGKRTIFNIVGPLINPASPKVQLIGVSNKVILDLYSEVLPRLGVKKAYVLHGADGIDEASISTKTDVVEVFEGKTKRFFLTPEDLGIGSKDISEIYGGDVFENRRIATSILLGERGAKRDIVVINSALLISLFYEIGFEEALNLAKESIDSKRAWEKLLSLCKMSGGRFYGTS